MARWTRALKIVLGCYFSSCTGGKFGIVDARAREIFAGEYRFQDIPPSASGAPWRFGRARSRNHVVLLLPQTGDDCGAMDARGRKNQGAFLSVWPERCVQPGAR